MKSGGRDALLQPALRFEDALEGFFGGSSY
jgi:hypothetical protein